VRAAPGVWGPAIDFSDAPIDRYIYHDYPLVAAGRNEGEIRVAWMDNRTSWWNLWYRETTDYGKSWTTPVCLSTLNADLVPLGFQSKDGFLFPYGDYGGMLVDRKGNTHVTWGEGFGWYAGGTVMYARQVSSSSALEGETSGWNDSVRGTALFFGAVVCVVLAAMFWRS